MKVFMKTLKIFSIVNVGILLSANVFAQNPPQFLPPSNGQIPMMQPQGAGGMNPAMYQQQQYYQQQQIGGMPPQQQQMAMVGEHMPAPGPCSGVGRNDYTGVVNQGGMPTPVIDPGYHRR